MASLTIRLSEDERASLERDSRTEGLSLSELVRRRALGAEPELADRLEGLERRVRVLESMARTG